MSDRPNIVFFMTDQLRADCVGVFGNPVVQTPNIDALAQRGPLRERVLAAQRMYAEPDLDVHGLVPTRRGSPHARVSAVGG